MASRGRGAPSTTTKKAKVSGGPELIGLSTDWYWEQDADLRFTRVDVQLGTPGDKELARRLVGRKRWETGIEIEGGWDAHRALLKARAPFRNVLMWRELEDGSRRYVSVSGEPVFDDQGRFAGYRGIGRDITEQKLSEARLRESEERYRRTFELAASGIAHIALDRRFVRVNRRICEILGYPEAELLGKTGREISHPEDLDVINELRPRLYAGEVETVRTDKRYRRKDGSTVWVTLTLALERDAGGRPLYEIAVCDDITPRKEMEAALRESEERFRSLTEMSSDFFWETDAEHRFLNIVHGPSYAGKLNPAEAGWAALRSKMQTHSAFRDFEFGTPLSDGTVRYFSISGDPHFAADGGFLGFRGVGRDITDVRVAREHIASLAYQDALTGLANRASLAPALHQAVERTKRRGSKLAALFIDLDGFKQVNDEYGHHAGDRLLVETARRLRASLRSGDPVARIGGDEFFAVLEDLHEALPVERVAQKLLAAIREPYDVGAGRQAVVSASIGISLFPDDAADADTLMKHADTAMYAAKQAGKDGYRFFGARTGGAGR